MDDNAKIQEDKLRVKELAGAMTAMQAALTRIRLLENALGVADRRFTDLQTAIGPSIMIMSWENVNRQEAISVNSLIEKTRAKIKEVL